MPWPVIAGIGAGLSGLGSIAGLFGDSDEEKLWEKQKEYDEKRRATMMAYMKQNMPNFQDPNYQFDPSQHEDVLAPVREQQGRQNMQLRNTMSLQGRGRGGQMPEMMGRLGREQSGDYANLLTGMARTGKEDAWKRAMQQWLGGMERTKAIGQYA